MTSTISTTYLIRIHYTILSNPHGMPYLNSRLFSQTSQMNGISRTYFCTFRTFGATISTFIGHLRLHQPLQITRWTQYLIRAHRHTKLTSRTMLCKMTKTSRSCRNNRSGTFRILFINKRRQSSIHFLFLRFHYGTCSK